MRHEIFIGTLVTTLSSAPVLADPGSTLERFEGVARSPAGALIYTETHEVTYRGDRPERSLTLYYDAAGKKIAELASDYHKDRYSPDYQFRDAAGGVIDAVELTRNGLHVQHRGEGKLIERSTDERMVCGQGLHQLVKAQIEQFAKRRDLVVRFAIPSRLDSYEFRITRVETPDPEVVRLKIGIDNWLLSLLAPSLEVDYDRRTRRLLSYRGVSNLNGPDGEPQQVSIEYRYPVSTTAAVIGSETIVAREDE